MLNWISGTEPDSSPSTDLFERREEYRAIADALRAVDTGREGRILYIRGPAGIGKTSLLSRVAADSSPPSLVLRGRGTELESGFQFGLVLDLFSQVVAAADRPPDLFEGAAALARPLFEEGIPGTGRDAAFALTHGLFWMCANLNRARPLVLIVDDCQWVDESSQRFIAYVAERVSDLNVLVAVAIRSGQTYQDGPVATALNQMKEVSPVEPGLLSRAAIQDLTTSRLGKALPDEELDRCWRLSGGNPFFVNELLVAAKGETKEDRQLFGEVPAGVQRLTAHRIAALNPGTQAVARTLAVLGEDATTSQVEFVADMDATQVAAAMDELTAAEMLEGGLRFRHPLLTQAVAESIPPGELMRLNLLAGEVIGGKDPERASRHLLVARPSGPCEESWVPSLLQEAVERARARGATNDAIRLLRRLIEEDLPRSDRLLALSTLGDLEAQRGDPVAVDHLAEAATLADDPVLRGRIALVRGESLFHLIELEKCSSVCREAIDELPGTERELKLQLEATALDADALRGVRRHHPATLEDGCRKASTPGERRVLSHVIADQSATGSATAESIRATGRLILDQTDYLEEVGPTSPTYIYLGTALAWAGAYDDALAITTRGIELGRSSGSPVAISYSAALRAGVALLAGNLDLAEEDSELIVTELAGADPMSYAVALGWYLEVLAEKGNVERAQETLDASGLTGDLPELGTIDFLMLARGRLRLAQGDSEGALREYLDVGDRVLRAGYPNPAAMDWRSRAAVLIAEQGNRDRAVELAAEELRLADAFGAPRPRGVALIAMGRVVGGPEGVEYLRQAGDLLKAVTPVEYARAMVELGKLLHSTGGADSRKTLYRGMDVAHHAGSSTLVERAMEVLRETGARPRRPSLRGADSLTPQERRISQLAANGMGNREIAETLFLTRRTVEMHLSNSYSKLGISSRKQLPDSLSEDAV